MFFFSRVKQKCLDVGILSLEIINIKHSLNTSGYKGGGEGEDFKILHIDGQLRHNGGEVVDPMSQKYSTSVFQNWLKIIFSYISMFVVLAIIGMNQLKLSCSVFIFWVSNQKVMLILVKGSTEFLCFSSLRIINTE